MTQAEIDTALMQPMADSFEHFYHMYGVVKAEALIASLIVFLERLEKNGEPVQ